MSTICQNLKFIFSTQASCDCLYFKESTKSRDDDDRIQNGFLPPLYRNSNKIKKTLKTTETNENHTHTPTLTYRNTSARGNWLSASNLSNPITWFFPNPQSAELLAFPSFGGFIYVLLLCFIRLSYLAHGRSDSRRLSGRKVFPLSVKVWVFSPSSLPAPNLETELFQLFRSETERKEKDSHQGQRKHIIKLWRIRALFLLRR